MSSVVQNVRAKLKRRFSHKDKEMNFDDVDSADEETTDMVNKEYTSAENDDANPMGKPGSLINRMLVHGNNKTEQQIEREAREAEAARQARAAQSQTQAGGVTTS